MEAKIPYTEGNTPSFGELSLFNVVMLAKSDGICDWGFSFLPFFIKDFFFHKFKAS